MNGYPQLKKKYLHTIGAQCSSWGRRGVTLRPVVGGGPSIPPLLAGVPWGHQGPKETVLSSDCCARAWLQLKATVRGVRCFLLVSGNLQIGSRVTGYSPH